VIAVFIACRLSLAATFLISGSGKFIGGGDQMASALRLSVPRLLARVTAALVIPLEFLLAGLLLFGDERTFEIGLAGSAVLLILFSAWMLTVLFRGLQVQCSCFGPSGAAVGWSQLARNAVLVAIALTGLLLAPSGRDAVGTTVWSALALAAASVLIMFVVAVRRAVPALALSVEQVGGAYSQQGDDAYAR
jgi:Methylamine utilisation protein MauE